MSEEKQSRRYGQPRTDVERIMRHYNVDRATAERVVGTVSLPPRGSGQEKK